MTIKADLIKKSIETGELQLDFWQKVTHFEIVIWSFSFSIIVPLMTLFMHLKDRYLGFARVLHNEVLWFSPALFVVGLVFYFVQKRRLRLTSIETDLEKAEINRVINTICRKRKWHKLIDKPNIVVASTPQAGGSWGEQVTIIFDKNTLYLNSICDPKRRSSVVSMGRNARNIEILVRKIRIH